MKIIIIGADHVGASIARILEVEEGNDITIVDTEERRKELDDLQNSLNIKTVVGEVCYPNVLTEAGADDADMLIALTAVDEINMLACQIAATIFHIPTKIARIRANEYLAHTELYNPIHLPIDVIVSPEQTVTKHIKKLIEYPGSFQVLDFANGKVKLIAMEVYEGSPLDGHTLRTLKQHIPNVKAKVVAIYRQDRAIFPTGDTVIQPGDDLFFLAPSGDIREVMKEMQPAYKKMKRIVIAGGGHIGKRLAEALEDKYQVKLIEYDSKRAQNLSETLHNTVVLQGDVSDQELLREENIDRIDLFCSVTNNDEANIISTMLAKRMGAGRVMAIVNNPAYADLVEGREIDTVISPQQTTLGALLTHIRRGDIEAVYSLRKGAAEALELTAHGDSKTSKVVGQAVDKLPLPPGSTIGAVVRGDEVFVLEKEVIVQSGDHVIIFVSDKKYISQVEALFQVSFGFI